MNNQDPIQDPSRLDKSAGKPVRTPRAELTQKKEVVMKRYFVYLNEDEPTSPTIVKAEGVGVTDDGHLLFGKGEIFVEGFAPGFWASFKEVENEESVEEIVAETIVEEALVEPVVEEPVVEEDSIEETIKLEVVNEEEITSGDN